MRFLKGLVLGLVGFFLLVSLPILGLAITLRVLFDMRFDRTLDRVHYGYFT